jgi:hypothetical protein
MAKKPTEMTQKDSNLARNVRPLGADHVARAQVDYVDAKSHPNGVARYAQLEKADREIKPFGADSPKQRAGYIDLKARPDLVRGSLSDVDLTDDEQSAQ